MPYFHVVFTLPKPLAALALQNQRTLYGLLFRAASETLLCVARDPKHLGARIGVLAVLHTWGQNLHHHPHLHCIVPGGGLSSDGQKWLSCRDDFFVPVRVLSRLFRGKFLSFLQQAAKDDELDFFGKLQHLADHRDFEAWLGQLWKTEWVVYVKPPFGGANQLLKYLARYTHRVAISNQRLISLKDGQVTFRWKDYASGYRIRTMTLQATEFVRRFLLHVLPNRFVRIRYYGLLANRTRSTELPKAKQLLEADSVVHHPDPLAPGPPSPPTEVIDQPELCPRCKLGRFRVVQMLLPSLAPVPILDSS